MKPFHPEINLFFNALVFFTRLPAPKGVDFSDANLSKASRYFPLIGLLIGVIAAFVWWLTAHIFDTTLAVLFSMLSTLLITGAFHEDGLADCADGFGGGWQKQQVLQIMKDSRIGSYGAIALVMILLFKYAALDQLLYPMAALILAHPLSRLAAVSIVHLDTYVRDSGSSKVQSAARQIEFGSLIIAALPVMLVLLVLADMQIWLVLIPVILVTQLCRRYFKRRIGGYTGDCLGACQQLTELTVYLWFCLI